MSQTDRLLTRAGCRDHLSNSTFRYRSPEYTKKYPTWPGMVGLEIEMLPIIPASHPGQSPKRVALQGPGESIAAILGELATRNHWRMTKTEDDHGREMLLQILLDEGDNISFEPGGQVEFSSKPYPCLGDATARMRSVQGCLDAALKDRGIELTQVGINPWHSLAELGLQMPKARYRAMDEYFSRIGPYGQRMMRQTCTIQVNLDFGPDENTLARRYLASVLLAPIATATFANSPIVDGKTTGARTFRSRVWRHTDPTHTGMPGLDLLTDAITRDDCIETYLKFALDAHVVFVAGLDYKVPRNVTFGDWLDRPIDGVSPTLADFETHMSLLFPEVRPRGFLELRSIDCQPRAFQQVPAAYMTGLLYDAKARDALIALLLPRKVELKDLLLRAETGLTHAPLAKLADQVMGLAMDGFERLPPCFKAHGSEHELTVFRESFTARGRTLADDILDRQAKDGTPGISLSSLRALEDAWARLAV